MREFHLALLGVMPLVSLCIGIYIGTGCKLIRKDEGGTAALPGHKAVREEREPVAVRKNSAGENFSPAGGGGS